MKIIFAVGRHGLTRADGRFSSEIEDYDCTEWVAEKLAEAGEFSRESGEIVPLDFEDRT